MGMMLCKVYLNGFFVLLFISTSLSVDIVCANQNRFGATNPISASDISTVKNAKFLISDYKYHPGQILVKYKSGHFPERLSAKQKGMFKKLHISNITMPGRYKARGVVSLKRLLRKRTMQAGALSQKNEKKLSDSKVRDSMERWAIVYLINGINIEKIIDSFIEDPDVERVSPDYEVSINTLPNDPLVDKLWGFNNTAQLIPAVGIAGSNISQTGTVDADIDVPEAWDVTIGDSTVVVAVIDTGVDYTHEDLAENMWINPGEIAGNGLDDDDNGFVDDINGADFINNDADPMDDHGHGTHVSGTISAVANNGVGVAGVAAGVKIMALKFLNSSGIGNISGAAMALDYAHEKNVRISNNSWGGGGFVADFMSILAGTNYDDSTHLFVAAAGNNNANTDAHNSSISHRSAARYPQGYEFENVLSVGATDFNDQRAFFSNYGSTSVDLSAPGVAVYSTVPRGRCRFCDVSGYGWLNGTSMATPHVTGVAALLLSQDSSLSATQLKARMMKSVDVIDGLRQKNITSGRINALNALTCNDVAPEILPNLQAGVAIYKAEGPVSLRVTLLNCYDMLRGATVTARFSNGDADIILYDDGLHHDEQADDGIYGGKWSPDNIGPLTVTFSSIHSQGDGQKSISVTVKFRFYRFEKTTYNWVDATQSGTVYSIPSNTSVDLPIGFDFNFYGQSKKNIKIWPNGTLTFSDDVPTNERIQRYPDIKQPNGMISPLWRQFSGKADTVYVLDEGVVPNRKKTVLWSFPALSGSYGAGRVAHIFEVTFHEGSGDIIFQYQDIPDKHVYGEWAAVGVEDYFGFDGTSYLFNDSPSGFSSDYVLLDEKLNPLVSGMALRFVPIGFPYDNLAPTAKMTVPESGFVANSISFNGAKSFDPEGQSLRYLWDFGDENNGEGLNAEHTYSTAGRYEVTLRVYDGVRYSDAASHLVTIIAGSKDLIITSLSTDDAKTAGVISIDAFIKNKGTAGVLSGFMTHFYLSSDAIMGNDIAIGSAHTAVSLGSEISVPVNLSVLLPVGLEPGTYRPVAVVGRYSGLRNDSGAGNFRLMGNAVTITIGPDFEAISIEHPVHATSGDVVSVSLSVRNNGSTSAYSNNKLYLSSDADISSNDFEIGTVFISDIGAGEIKNGKVTFIVPSGIDAGDYFLGVIVDWPDSVTEVDEENNNFSSKKLFSVGVSDLAPTAMISAPSTGITLETVSFSGDASTDPEFDPLYYKWSFGDGYNSTERNPVHRYSTSGTYTVTLTVNDGIQDSAMASNVISIDDGADLMLSNVTPLESQIYRGDISTVSMVLNNIGSVSVLGYKRHRFTIKGYLDSDNDPSNGYIKQVFTEYYFTAPLPGKSLIVTAKIKFDVATGPQYIWFQVSTTGECKDCLANNISVSKIPVNVQLDVDLRITDITTDLLSLTKNVGFTVSSTVTNAGLSSVKPGHRVQLYISDDAVITRSDPLLAGGFYWMPGQLAAGASVTYDRDVIIPGHLPTGTYYLGAIADAQDVQDETNENNNSSVGVEVQIIEDDVDLVIDNIVISQQSSPIGGSLSSISQVPQGSNISISTSVNNTGKTRPVNYRVKLYLSTEKSVNSSSLIVDQWSVIKHDAETINNHVSTLLLDVNIEPKTYYLLAFADSSNQQSETDEGNNVGVKMLEIITPGPDLVVSNMSSSVSRVGPGDSFILTNTVVNQGQTTTINSFNIGLYLSLDPQITVADRLIKFRGLSGLLSGEAGSADSSVYISSTQPPECYYLGAIVDYSQRVAESCAGCELNNTLLGPKMAIGNVSCEVDNNKPFAVINGPYKAKTDQAVVFNSSGTVDTDGDPLTYLWDFGDGTSSALVNPSHTYITAGEFSATLVVNDGIEDSLPVVTIVSITDNRIPEGVLKGPVSGITDALSSFDGSASSDVDGDPLIFFWDFGDGVSISTSEAQVSHSYSKSGTYIATLIVNDGIIDSVTVSTIVTINDAAPFSDVAMKSLMTLFNLATGESFNINSTVMNQGSERTNNAVYVRYYLSTDTVYDGKDYPVYNHYAGYLNAGESKNLNGRVTVPTSLSTGKYYLLAIADPYNIVLESDDPDNLKGNNLIVSSSVIVVTIGADVSIDSLIAPSRAGTGEIINVESSVVNHGVGKTNAAVIIRYYFSKDSIYDAADTYAYNRYLGYLDAGQMIRTRDSFSVPTKLAEGQYHLLAIADPHNVVLEIDDPDNLNGNNLAVSPDMFMVTIGADIEMGYVTNPSDVSTGELINVSSSIMNSGTGKTNAAVFVRYYFSVDEIFDAKDTYAYNRYVGYLNAGQTVNLDNQFLVPTSLSSGPYFLLAIADPFNIVLESDDPDNQNGNNLAVSSGPLNVSIGADIAMVSVTAPVEAEVGESIQVKSTVVNRGSGKTNAAVNVRYYFSTDATYDATDVYAHNRYVGYLDADQSVTLNETVTIPAGLPAGSYFLLAVADLFNNVLEIDSPDNFNGNNLQVTEKILITH
ncbi:MAG: S8 family serine peptidase [Ectothiorhodospiraceae bacterium]|nr:S8 family serine peptidase [Ectothiorhodospiraceae bacterium]